MNSEMIDCSIISGYIIKDRLPIPINTSIHYIPFCSNEFSFDPVLRIYSNHKEYIDINLTRTDTENKEKILSIINHGKSYIIDPNPHITKQMWIYKDCGLQINSIEHELLEESAYLFENLVQELEEFSKIKNILPSLQSSWKNFTGETKKNSLSQYSLKTNLEAQHTRRKYIRS